MGGQGSANRVGRNHEKGRGREPRDRKVSRAVIHGERAYRREREGFREDEKALRRQFVWKDP
jgi:hypothetical protein